MISPSPLLYNTYYHIYNRGVNRENIFVEERNYDLFLRLYAKHLSPIADLFAYCLLRNHIHMAVRVKSEEERLEWNKTSKASPGSTQPLRSNHVSIQFANFFNAYAKTINKAYGRTGSLFQHPFGRVPVRSDRQFWNVIAYIHQNPQKHGFVKDFREWKYSSYGAPIMSKQTPIKCRDVMKWFGTKENYVALHEQWVTDLKGLEDS